MKDIAETILSIFDSKRSLVIFSSFLFVAFFTIFPGALFVLLLKKGDMFTYPFFNLLFVCGCLSAPLLFLGCVNYLCSRKTRVALKGFSENVAMWHVMMASGIWGSLTSWLIYIIGSSNWVVKYFGTNSTKYVWIYFGLLVVTTITMLISMKIEAYANNH